MDERIDGIRTLLFSHIILEPLFVGIKSLPNGLLGSVNSTSSHSRFHLDIQISPLDELNDAISLIHFVSKDKREGSWELTRRKVVPLIEGMNPE